MIFFVEDRTETDWREDYGFFPETLGRMVCEKILLEEEILLSVEVNLTLVDGEEIRCLNRDYRDIDAPTDVLSFPNLSFEEPARIPPEEGNPMYAGSVNPENGCLFLGDIILNKERVLSQAGDYGHSVEREFAFLVAHSMLHLLGYDHEEEGDATRMEQKQEACLTALGIVRE